MNGMMTMINTKVEQFSERYGITQFNVDIGNYESLEMSLMRAEDIRNYWWDTEDVIDGYPVVLESGNKHLVTKENVQVEYNTLRVPACMKDTPWISNGIHSFLVPDEHHTRLLTTY